MFTQLLGGSAAATVMPTPRVTTVVAAAESLPKGRYVWAETMARAQPRISVSDLARGLKLPEAQARVLFDQMIARGAIGAPNAVGIARATAPVWQSGVPKPGPRKITHMLRSRLKHWMREAAHKKARATEPPEPGSKTENMGGDQPLENSG